MAQRSGSASVLDNILRFRWGRNGFDGLVSIVTRRPAGDFRIRGMVGLFSSGIRSVVICAASEQHKTISAKTNKVVEMPLRAQAPTQYAFAA
jgi:hypothetical protein